MDDRMKELIAVGASVSANCQPCLRYHAGKAEKAGAAREEISEAIGVGKMVAKGAMSKMNKYAEAIFEETPPEESDPGEGCGCS